MPQTTEIPREITPSTAIRSVTPFPVCCRQPRRWLKLADLFGQSGSVTKRRRRLRLDILYILDILDILDIIHVLKLQSLHRHRLTMFCNAGYVIYFINCLYPSFRPLPVDCFILSKRDTVLMEAYSRTLLKQWEAV